MSKQYQEVEIDPIAKEQLMLYPAEQLDPIERKFKKLTIGIPRENSIFEKRIALRPEAVAVLTRNGHHVLIESGAGMHAKFEDREYSEAGAEITPSVKEIFESDIVLKIQPPSEDELEYMKPGRTLISTLHMTTLTTEYLRILLRKKIIGVAFEFIQDKVGGMPAVRTMSEIAGSTVMLIAAEFLSSYKNGKGIIMGGVTGVPPTKVVIVGAGTVGEYATRTAMGLGAEVKVFDRHIYKLRRLKYATGHQVYTSTIDGVMLSDAISRADVLLTAVRAEKGRSPIIVTEDMVRRMKPNSIIIDVSIDQGGCVETSEPTTLQNPTFVKYGVIHYCVPNIASRVARTSSTALSNIFAPYLLEIGESGGIDEMIFKNKWFMKGVYAYKGSLTNPDVANKFNLPHKDLGLLMAARL
ncbi:MAG: alanine dehydrogenase [Microscillaceae bacterium]|nr:alanine dehydrogenase [Microscillaceae bacterium]